MISSGINILLIADFQLLKTGIYSTAVSLLSNFPSERLKIYSNQELEFLGKRVLNYSENDDVKIDLVFTSLEYSGLCVLMKKYPQANFHVGDWPISYWKSTIRFNPIKGILVLIRCYFRLQKLCRNSRIIFVTDNDRMKASKFGFVNSIHLPIGVNPPTIQLNKNIDFHTICFSGSFRYEPNRDAAKLLLHYIKSYSVDLNVILVGYHADDFCQESGVNLETYSDVNSIPDFLASRRPIYISLLRSGSGAKNKILEAVVSGCPVICTRESLDDSIPECLSVNVINKASDVVNVLTTFKSIDFQNNLENETLKLANVFRMNRTWGAVASNLRDYLLSEKIVLSYYN